MPTYDGIGTSITHNVEVDGNLFLQDIEGGPDSTRVPLEIFSNLVSSSVESANSRMLRLRVQNYGETNTSNSYVTDVGIRGEAGKDYFFITAPQNTSNVGDQNTFVISSTSNVGIGTTNPVKPLHVVGDSWVTGTLTASNIIGASPITISSNLVMASGFTLTAGAIEPPTDSESNLKITGTITTSNITHDSELTITSNLLMGSDKTLTTSNIVGSPSLTVTANTNVVAEFTESSRYYHVKEPRSVMTANSSFGYTASASSNHGSYGAPWYAFNHNTSVSDQAWHGENNRYDDNGNYTYSPASSIGGYTGEWLKIQMPSSIKLKYITLYGRSQTYSNLLPVNGTVVGSTDGSNWTAIKSWTNYHYVDGVPTTIQINSTNYYNYFALVFEKIDLLSSSDARTPNLGEWELYGTPYTAATNDGTSVLFKSVPNTPKTDFLDVYYDASNANSSSTTVKNIVDDSSATPVDLTFTSTDPKAWYFNGTTSNVTGTHGLGTGNVPHSHAVWFKRTSVVSPAGGDYIVSIGTQSNSQASLVYIYSNQIYFDIFADFKLIANTIIENDTWYHYVVSYNGEDSTTKIYINGQPEGFTTIGSATLNLTGTALALGSNNTSGEYFNGSIANYRLYDRALSADEVWELYGYQKAYFSVSPDVVTYKAGRVGIGTSEPRAVLDVVGDIMSNGLYVNSNFVVGTSNLFVDTATGNVGIGTDSPASILHVYGRVSAATGPTVCVRTSTQGDTTVGNGGTFALPNIGHGAAGWGYVRDLSGNGTAPKYFRVGMRLAKPGAGATGNIQFYHYQADVTSPATVGGAQSIFAQDWNRQRDLNITEWLPTNTGSYNNVTYFTNNTGFTLYIAEVWIQFSDVNLDGAPGS